MAAPTRRAILGGVFEKLRDEVDKARWERKCKEWKKLAAKALGVKRSAIYLALPADDSWDVLVVYYHPQTDSRLRGYPEDWCLRVDARNGWPIGEPIRLLPGNWVSHWKDREWEQEWRAGS